MNLKKKIEVVILPTEKASLILSNDGNELMYDSNTVHLGGYKKDCVFTPQHLYFISDEISKVGDWYYDSHNNIILKATTQSDHNIYQYKKVIASTDKSLGLPEPPLAFIHKYNCNWNKGNKIQLVMVNYSRNDYFGETCGQLIPKVDKNNQIIITGVQDSWTREELTKILADFLTDCWNKNYNFNGLAHDEVSKIFIEENL